MVKWLRRRADRRGFTLIEAMVTIVMTAVIGLAMLRAHLGVRQAVHTTRVHQEATNLLRTYIEQKKATEYEDMNSDYYWDITLSDNGTPDDTTDDVNGWVYVDVWEDETDMKTVYATAMWSTHLAGGQFSYQYVNVATKVADI